MKPLDGSWRQEIWCYRDAAVSGWRTLPQPDDCFPACRLCRGWGARTLGARKDTLVAPYLAYTPQDRRFQPNGGVDVEELCRAISSTLDQLPTIDLHLHRYLALYAISTN